jgi:hypothetical protein
LLNMPFAHNSAGGIIPTCRNGSAEPPNTSVRYGAASLLSLKFVYIC